MSKAGTESDGSGDGQVQFSTNVKYFDRFLESLESLREEGRLVFTDGRIYSKVADPSNVAMCIAKVEGRALTSLSVNSDEPIEVGVDFEKLRQAFKNVSSTSEVEVTYPIKNGAQNMFKLYIVEEGITFEIPALRPNSVPDIPENDPLSHKTQLNVDGSDLKSSVKHAQKVPGSDGYSIDFKIEDNTFKIATDDQVEGSFSKEFPEAIDEDVGDVEDMKTMIAISYLDDIDQVLGRASPVTVHIRDGFPIRFDVPIDSDGDAQALYIIAPRKSGES